MEDNVDIEEQCQVGASLGRNVMKGAMTMIKVGWMVEDSCNETGAITEMGSFSPCAKVKVSEVSP